MTPYLLIVGGSVLLLMVVIGIGVFNRLVTLRNRYQNAYAQIDVQLKRRYDLIPNLVETAKGYIKHERETLEAVIRARNAAVAANADAARTPGAAGVMSVLNGAESMLSGLLGRFMALAEAYPDLKANESMGKLMEELSSTENRVSFARQAYNDAVTQFNITREKFPNVIIAGMTGFRAAELFELDTAAAAEAPKISLT